MTGIGMVNRRGGTLRTASLLSRFTADDFAAPVELEAAALIEHLQVVVIADALVFLKSIRARSHLGLHFGRQHEANFAERNLLGDMYEAIVLASGREWRF